MQCGAQPTPDPCTPACLAEPMSRMSLEAGCKLSMLQQHLSFQDEGVQVSTFRFHMRFLLDPCTKYRVLSLEASEEASRLICRPGGPRALHKRWVLPGWREIRGQQPDAPVPPSRHTARGAGAHEVRVYDLSQGLRVPRAGEAWEAPCRIYRGVQ